MSEISVAGFDARQRALALGLGELGDLSLLPRGFEIVTAADVTIHQEASTLKKLLAEANIPLQIAGAKSGKRIGIQKSADWVAPILFVGAGLWSQNPLAVQVAVSVLGSYATDILKGVGFSKRVSLTLVVESTKGKTTKMLTYEGPVEGLAKLASAAERIANE